MSSSHLIIAATSALLLFTACRKSPLTFEVTSQSMAPSYSPGDLVQAVSYRSQDRKLRRFDVVTFHPPQETHEQLGVMSNTVFMFRVWGLPGDEIIASREELVVNVPTKGWQLRLNVGLGSLSSNYGQKNDETKWSLGASQLFVLGDNLTNANDSRIWGPLDISNVTAIVLPMSGGKRPTHPQ